ncbi:MAG: polysaccharide pyruvyl transferase CsaB [Abditibacteriota bacterium]|nr:polysaccharide pyruvyl transferase CsaB [Abditibacteriota bacterium]
MSRKILLSGYYGFGNAGDEAVLSGILSSLSEALDGDITVLSSNPAYTLEHHNVSAVHRYKQLLPAVAGCDLLISGGGSLLQDATSKRSIYYYLAVLRLAQIMGKKTMIYAQGIGPVNSNAARKATAKAINKADAVTVRDTESAELLREIGVTKDITVVGDPALLVKAVPYTRRGYIALAPRRWGADNLAEIARGVKAAAEELGLDVIALPMQKSEDTEVCESMGFATETSLESVGEIKGFFASSAVTVAMRLHALIFAAGEGVPVVPVSYDPKVDAFARECGVEPLKYDGLKGEELTKRIIDACGGPKPNLSKIKSSAYIPAGAAAELLK